MSDGRAGQSREVVEAQQPQPQPSWLERHWDATISTNKIAVGVQTGKLTMDGILPRTEIVWLPMSLNLESSNMKVDTKTGAASLVSDDGKRVVFSYSPAGENDRFAWSGNVLSKIVTPTQTFSYDAEKEVWLVKNTPSLSPSAYDSQSKVHCAHFKSGEVEQTFELAGAVTIERLAETYKKFVDGAKMINAYLSKEKKSFFRKEPGRECRPSLRT